MTIDIGGGQYCMAGPPEQCHHALIDYLLAIHSGLRAHPGNQLLTVDAAGEAGVVM